MTTSAQAPPSIDFAGAIRSRLRGFRQQRGLSFAAVAARTDITPSQLVAIEGASSVNLYLDQLLALAEAYDVALIDVVLGPSGRRPAPYVAVGSDALHAHVRACLRRDRGDVGTPRLAELADMEQSTLVRWESGEYRRLDVIRLHRLATALKRDLRNWLTPS